MARAPLAMPIVLYARAAGTLRRWLDRTDRLAAALLSAALTADEKSALGVRLYDASPAGRGTALWPWEPGWLARRLPPPPARILVGACGAGRELLALAAAGYTLDAFEPAPSLARLAQARIGERARVLSFRYEDLSAAILDGAHSPAAALATRTYDAVLLGWSSLSHVLDPAERVRLLRAIDRLCPRGPLLASFFCVPSSSNDAAAPGRIERHAAAWGRRVARMRKLPDAPSAREAFLLHGGFARVFTRSEIAALAAAVGRELEWDDDDTDYGHATFVVR
ncbi:MAG TPA: hypothetical protein VF334_08110 [Polyangia bacterium]